MCLRCHAWLRLFKLWLKYECGIPNRAMGDGSGWWVLQWVADEVVLALYMSRLSHCHVEQFDVPVFYSSIRRSTSPMLSSCKVNANFARLVGHKR